MTGDRLKKAEQVLIDNGIEKDEAYVVLQALGYVLCDEEWYPEKQPVEEKVRIKVDIQYVPTFWMEINVPTYRDKEEYIDEFLDGLLAEDLKYNTDWEEE